MSFTELIVVFDSQVSTSTYTHPLDLLQEHIQNMYLEHEKLKKSFVESVNLNEQQSEHIAELIKTSDALRCHLTTAQNRIEEKNEALISLRRLEEEHCFTIRELFQNNELLRAKLAGPNKRPRYNESFPSSPPPMELPPRVRRSARIATASQGSGRSLSDE